MEFVLDRWRVPRVRNRSSGDLIHPAVAYVLDADGRLRFQTSATRAAVSVALDRLERGSAAGGVPHAPPAA